MPYPEFSDGHLPEHQIPDRQKTFQLQIISEPEQEKSNYMPKYGEKYVYLSVILLRHYMAMDRN